MDKVDDSSPRSLMMTMEGRTRHYRRRYVIVGVIFLAVIIPIVVVVVLKSQNNNNNNSNNSNNQQGSSSPQQQTVSEVNNDTLAPTPIRTAEPTPKPSRTPTRSPTMAPTMSVADYVKQLIRSVAIFGGSEFENRKSYQSKALTWVQSDAALVLLLLDDGVGGPTNETSLSSQRQDNHDNPARFSDTVIVQRYALACIYYATNRMRHVYTDLYFDTSRARPWRNKTNWLSAQSECEWYGVTCRTTTNNDITTTTTTTSASHFNTTHSESVVVELNLNENDLTGSFPQEVTLLSLIQRIDLYDNPLWNTGEQGNAWLGNMTSLEYLFYGSTYFDYDQGIPTQLSQLLNLKEYDCSYTLYRGPLLGDAFVGLVNLEYLSLSGNAFRASTIPSQLASLPNLKRLYMQETSLTGTVDVLLSSSSSSISISISPLVEVWLDNNDLKGSLPTTIATTLTTTLGSLSLSNNRLSGTLPSALKTLTLLEQLWLYNNTITGTIPSDLGTSLESLQILYLDGTRLSGRVPVAFCELDPPMIALVADCEQEIKCSCCTGCM